jgi:hypothetical protein
MVSKKKDTKKITKKKVSKTKLTKSKIVKKKVVKKKTKKLMIRGEYLNSEKSYKTFLTKSKLLQEKINETLSILEQFGLSIQDKTPRLKEKIAIAFLALGEMSEKSKWKELKSISKSQKTSREIIIYENEKFNEDRSSGSYDDVRREDLKEMVLANIVLNSKPNSAKNDPTRKYGISEEYASVIRKFGSNDWGKRKNKIIKKNGKLIDRTNIPREFKKVPIKISENTELSLSVGEHNELQKAIIEEFLPRFCPDGELLYLGDSENKDLINEKEKLLEIGFFGLDHGMLPDIVAYRKDKKWLYLVEAVHTANPMTKTRKVELENLTSKCKVEIIYVSAFVNRKKFKEWVSDLAWETEVWISEEQDHLIHFNGHKFLGPY